MKLTSEFDDAVYVCAFRYALPRHSYMPHLIRNKLDEVWDSLPDTTRGLILVEILEHKEYLERLYKGKELDFNTEYDLKEWLIWREKKLAERSH